jgi:hypothetical protein
MGERKGVRYPTMMKDPKRMTLNDKAYLALYKIGLHENCGKKWMRNSRMRMGTSWFRSSNLEQNADQKLEMGTSMMDSRIWTSQTDTDRQTRTGPEPHVRTVHIVPQWQS